MDARIGRIRACGVHHSLSCACFGQHSVPLLLPFVFVVMPSLYRLCSLCTLTDRTYTSSAVRVEALGRATKDIVYQMCCQQQSISPDPSIIPSVRADESV